ncbi:hypothetical protein ONZ45_g1177 [Pleurotus djamor]|nr:hypothetical protein ONZ45_g1177 [Pleurotus djamor]
MLRFLSLLTHGPKNATDSESNEKGSVDSGTVIPKQELGIDADADVERRSSEDTAVYQPHTCHDMHRRLEIVERQQQEILSLLGILKADMRDMKDAILIQGSNNHKCKCSGVNPKPKLNVNPESRANVNTHQVHHHYQAPPPPSPPKLVSRDLSHSDILSKITPLDPSSPTYTVSDSSTKGEPFPDLLLKYPTYILHHPRASRSFLLTILYLWGIPYDSERDSEEMMRMRVYRVVCDEIIRQLS